MMMFFQYALQYPLLLCCLTIHRVTFLEAFIPPTSAPPPLTRTACLSRRVGDNSERFGSVPLSESKLWMSSGSSDLTIGSSKDTRTTAISSTAVMDQDDDGSSTTTTSSSCPLGYYLNSVNEQCQQLSPLGKLSQRIENYSGKGIMNLKQASTRISELFGVDTQKISSLGIGFALSYAIISTINGAISLSLAWYLSCKRTGLSPLVPGQWKSLIAAYGTIYAIIQFLRPFRVAAAVAMSKLSKEFLIQTEMKLNCNRQIAIAFQYTLGWITWAAVSVVGISLASFGTGVPIF